MKKQRIFGLMTVFAMVLGVCASLVGGLSASAAATEQSVTIHKLQFGEMPESIPNTGDSITFPGSNPLAGAGFTAYDVTTAYWNAYDAKEGDFEAKKAAGLAAAEAVDTDEITDEDLIFDFGLTGDEGTATRSLPITSGGKKAIYKFVETTTPAGVNQTISASFILGLPIYNADNTLKTPVHVYPKNEVKILDLGFTKYGVDVAGVATTLDGAQFILRDGDSEYYYNSENGKFDKSLGDASKLTSAGGGKVSVPGLFEPGIYKFYEIDNTVSKSADQDKLDPALPEEIFHYKKNPVVTATVAADMTVSYVYYDQQMNEMTTGTPKAYNYKVTVPEKTVDDSKVDAGQTVTFTITHKIPDDVAQYTEYALVDNYDSRLSLLKEGMANIENFKIGTTELDPADLGATYASETNQFSLTFDMDLNALAEYAGQMMSFTVDMKVSPGADLSTIDNKITFDNNFYDKDDTVEVNTYGKKFIKVDADTNEALNGAEFKIKKGDKFLQLLDNDGNLAEEGRIEDVSSGYIVNWVDAADDATIFVSPANGEFGIYGLEQLGEQGYTLVETKAPDGYNLIEDVPFDADDSMEALQVFNKSKGILPSTGGTGIVAFVLIGVVALGGAALYFTKGRRQIEG